MTALSDKGTHVVVDVVSHKTEVTTLDDLGVSLLDILASGVVLGVSLSRVLLKWEKLNGPENGADFLEVSSITLDKSVNDVFDTDHSRVCRLPKKLFNQVIVGNGHSLIFFSKMTTLADEVIHDVLGWVPKSNVVLDLKEPTNDIWGRV